MTNDIELPQAIFYDWDGTLVDSYKFLESAHNHVRQELGLPGFKGDEFKNYFGHPREKLYTELYGHDIERAKALFGDYVVNNHITHLKPMPGAKELLEVGQQAGLIMGVISNKKAEYLHREIRSFGWEDYFKVVIGAGDAAQDKPAADPLLKAVKETDFDSMENIWYVGDTDVDLQCAKNAACKAVFIAHDHRAEEWANLYKPFLIFKNCTELREFLLQFGKKRIKPNTSVV